MIIFIKLRTGWNLLKEEECKKIKWRQFFQFWSFTTGAEKK